MNHARIAIPTGLVNPSLSGQFLLLDTNGNGALEPAEFSRFEVMGAATTRGTPGPPAPRLLY